MKKFLGFILIGLMIYAIYIDLTIGSLPKAYTQKVEARTQTASGPANGGKAYFTEKAEPGDTVISIVERHIDKALPVSIQDLIIDFRELNPGKSPEKIQIGATYKFPDYSK